MKRNDLFSELLKESLSKEISSLSLMANQAEIQDFPDSIAEQMRPIFSGISNAQNLLYDYESLFEYRNLNKVSFDLKILLKSISKSALDSQPIKIQLDEPFVSRLKGQPDIIRVLIRCLFRLFADQKESKVFKELGVKTIHDADSASVKLELKISKMTQESFISIQETLAFQMLQRALKLLSADFYFDSEAQSLFFKLSLESDGSMHSDYRRLSDLHELNIAYVDGSLEHSNLLCQSLENQGLNLNVYEGLSQLEEEIEKGVLFDLLILDPYSIQQNGFEWLELQDKVLFKKIIFLCSRGRKGDAQRCQDIGVNAYFVKPTDVIQLWESIRILFAEEKNAKKKNIDTQLLTRYYFIEEEQRLHLAIVDWDQSLKPDFYSTLNLEAYWVDRLQRNDKLKVNELKIDSACDLILFNIPKSGVNEELLSYAHHLRDYYPDLPILVLSADLGLDLCRVSFAEDILYLPFHIEKINRSIKNLLINCAA